MNLRGSVEIMGTTDNQVVPLVITCVMISVNIGDVDRFSVIRLISVLIRLDHRMPVRQFSPNLCVLHRLC